MILVNSNRDKIIKIQLPNVQEEEINMKWWWYVIFLILLAVIIIGGTYLRWNFWFG